MNPKLTVDNGRCDKFKIYISALTQLNIDEHNRIPIDIRKVHQEDCTRFPHTRRFCIEDDFYVGFSKKRRGKKHISVSGRSGCDV